MQRYHLFEEDRLGASDVLDRLTGHRLGQKADEVAGMAGFECNADLAVGLEAADAGTVAGSRIDDDEWPQLRIDLDAVGRNDAHKGIIYRPIELAAVHDQFDLVVEHVRRGFGHVLAILIAALTHTSQNSTLRWAASIAYPIAAANAASGEEELFCSDILLCLHIALMRAPKVAPMGPSAP